MKKIINLLLLIMVFYPLIYSKTFAIGSPTPPTVGILDASNITNNSVTLNGDITSVGSNNINLSRRGFEYGFDSSYGSTVFEDGTFVTGTFLFDLSELKCATTYYYRAFGVNSTGTGVSIGSKFTTNECPKRKVSTGTSLATINLFKTQQNNLKIDKEDSENKPEVNRINLFKTERILKYGMTGEDIKELQVYLNKNGFYLSNKGYGSLGMETEYFGLKTKIAVLTFQYKNNLTPDGIVGPETKEKMK